MLIQVVSTTTFNTTILHQLSSTTPSCNVRTTLSGIPIEDVRMRRKYSNFGHRMDNGPGPSCARTIEGLQRQILSVINPRFFSLQTSEINQHATKFLCCNVYHNLSHFLPQKYFTAKKMESRNIFTFIKN